MYKPFSWELRWGAVFRSGVQGGFGFGSGDAEEKVCLTKVELNSTTLGHIHATSLEQNEFLF